MPENSKRNGKLAVVALGGNALLRDDQRGTIEEQEANATATLKHMMFLIEDGYDLSEKLDEVTNRVSTIRTFPPEAERPQISLASRAERVITLVLSGDLSEKEVKNLGEQLRVQTS